MGIFDPIKEAYNAGKQLAGVGPKRRLAVEGNTTKLARGMTKAGYDFSAIAPWLAFTKNPGLTTGASAAIALPAPFMAKSLKVGLGKDGRALAKALNKQVDSKIVPFGRDIRGELNMVMADPRKGVRAGGFYGSPGFKGEFGQFVDDRTAIIQDPITGTMFSAPGAVHGELIKWVAQNYPQFAKGHPKRWLQHEVYAPHDFGGGLDPVPARIMWGLTPGRLEQPRLPQAAQRELEARGVYGDSMIATVARARLMQALAGRGVRQDEGLAKWLESRVVGNAKPALRKKGR